MSARKLVLICLALLAVSACGGGGGSGSGAVSGPAPRLALFTTSNTVTGSEVISDYTVTQACPGCPLQSVIGVYGPDGVAGPVTASTVKVGTNLELDAADFIGESGPYDLYHRSRTFDTGATYLGFPVYNTVTTDARILRSGEDGAAYNYASYGYWEANSSLSAAFPPRTGYTAFGIQPGNVPGVNSASYSGVWDGYLMSGKHLQTSGSYRAHMEGTVALTADFGLKTLVGQLNVAPGSISGGASLAAFQMDTVQVDAGFAGGPIAGQASSAMTYDGQPVTLSGDLGGSFYGPSAAELGAAFVMGAADGSLNMIGGLAAKR